ncbi:hypothetical protein [Levilactobacillus senmaizukei]|nr:hypothetical protein [Levilactobacillus senmaizukei]
MRWTVGQSMLGSMAIGDDAFLKKLGQSSEPFFRDHPSSEEILSSYQGHH